MTLLTDARGHLTEHSDILEVSGVRYLIEHVVSGELPFKGAGPVLATVIDINECHHITAEWIQNCIERYSQIDDVFQVKFLEAILFRGASQGQCSLSLDAQKHLESLGTRWHQFLNDELDKQPLPGAYVILDGGLYEAFRLYADTHAAFFQATRVPRLLDTSDDNLGQVVVAVPSRLGSHISHKPPLSRIRVGVKDNFDLEGTKTSLCSRSYLQLYPRKGKSAPCLQRLLDLGVSVIGKTKLCAFAQWEEPTEAIEYTSPWSPRADGFQSSGGSSNGSGAAVAAYDWVDITIGSDSTWTLQLSWAATLSCVVTLLPPGTAIKYQSHPRLYLSIIYTSNPAPVTSSQFSAVLWPTDYWNLVDLPQRTIATNFAHEIASFLKLPYREYSMKEVWQSHPPEDAGDQSLDEYMLKASAAPSMFATKDMWYDDYHAFDEFRELYWAKYKKAPYLTPPTRAAWSSCKSIPLSDRDEAARRVQVFRSWFQALFFTEDHPLRVMPIENVGTRYRDEPPEPPTGVHALLLSAFASAPELVLPSQYNRDRDRGLV
ncbi:MAG: hypothetical protein Q9195_003521 [Heterodermia aff. obscurata]